MTGNSLKTSAREAGDFQGGGRIEDFEIVVKSKVEDKGW
jgi:hypothetical protein